MLKELLIFVGGLVVGATVAAILEEEDQWLDFYPDFTDLD